MDNSRYRRFSLIFLSGFTALGAVGLLWLFLSSPVASVQAAAGQPVAQSFSPEALTALEWHTRTLDASGDAGKHASLAFSPESAGVSSIGVAYYDATHQSLKYAVNAGGGWVTETVDNGGNVGEYASLAFTPRNPSKPHISYYDATHQDLMHAYYNGSTWVTETVDTAGNVGRFTSIAIAPILPFTIYISYEDFTNGDLKIASSTGSGWTFETVDSGGGQYSSLKLHPAAPYLPRISYYDSVNRTLKYAYDNGTRWTKQTVDGNSPLVGQYTSLALSRLSPYVPHIIYYDNDNTSIKHAYLYKSTWISETVAGTGDIDGTAVVVDAAGHPHAAYTDGTGKLQYFAYDGATWLPGAPVNLLGNGTFPSLLLDAVENPHLAYYDWSKKTLNYARGDLPPSAVSILGPTEVLTGTPYGFTAQVSPAQVSLPITYSWTATGQPEHIDTSVWSRSSTIEYIWPTLGPKIITVTAHNGCGSVTTSFNVTVTASATAVAGLSLSGPAAGQVGSSYIYTAAVNPVNATPPFTYTWQADDQAPIVESRSSLSHSVYFAWTTIGSKTITVTAANSAGSAVATQTVTVASLPLLYVPPELHRLAALHLAEERASGATPEWAQARLSDNVRPLYRPDVAGEAYYEFPVIIPGSLLPGELGATQADQPAGFIIVSTGAHDFPITNWASKGASPTQRLQQKAAAAGKTAVKFYKLDTLAYAAENAQGQQVATDGSQPPKVSGIDLSALDNPVVTEIEWTPHITGYMPDDSLAALTGTAMISGPLTSTLQLGAWASWDELKSGYVQAYGVLAEDVRRRAAPAWEGESAARDYGRPVWKGETHVLPLLWDDPLDVTVTGEGAAYIDTVLTTPPGLPPVLTIHVLNGVPGQSVPFTVTALYPDYPAEEVRFQIATKFYQVYLPLATKAGAAPGVAGESVEEQSLPDQAMAGQALQAQGDWNTWMVGTDDDQCWYSQYSGAQDPTWPYVTCKSGCGPTAWAMLFCWADNQALPSANNSYWLGRWGLYRVDGGRGADDVAPKTWGDPHPGVKNMIGEIRDDLGTWCAGDSGPTFPWDMEQVTSYVSGRSNVKVLTKYNSVGATEDRIIDFAREAIRDDDGKARPAVIGTGWLSHYPLAYGYRNRQRTSCLGPICWPWHEHNFFVNQGWEDGTGEWVSGNIWFAGRIRPYQAYATDVAVYRPSDGSWHFDYNHNGGAADQVLGSLGITGSPIPVAGDFDRDRLLDDIGLYVSSPNNSWYGRLVVDDDHNGVDIHSDIPSSGPLQGAKPFAVDSDRDGFADDLGLFNPSTQKWYFWVDRTGYYVTNNIRWGLDGDLPVAGDFDRDGFLDDVAVYRPYNGWWVFDYDHDGDEDASNGPWGLAEDLPVAGDFDEDGFADDVALYRSSDRKWRYDHNYNAGTTNDTVGPFGLSGDIPLAGMFAAR